MTQIENFLPRFVAASFFVLVFAGGCGSPENAATQEDAHSEIAFTSSRTGNHDVYLMTVDSDSVVNLTNHPASEYGVSWSSDGNRLLFGTDRDGNREIYSMLADGTELANLSNHPGIDTSAEWSPDGSKIAFVSD